MFKNIGHKIKVFAKIICWIGIICSVLFGLMVMFGSAGATEFVSQYGQQYGQHVVISGGFAIFVGIVIIVVGVLASWIGSFMTYGFGQLIENTEEIKKSLEK